jgi:hypothetical protein
MGEKRNAYRINGKARRKETIRKTICRWVNNFKMDLRGTVWDSVDRINLAQDRDYWRVSVNTVMKLRVP